MREILFRGKRKDNSKWVYGNYAVTDNNEKQQHFIFQNKAFEFEVESETVGQYTGLTDKNGKKIFEGDIVKNPRYVNVSDEIQKYDIGIIRFRRYQEPSNFGKDKHQHYYGFYIDWITDEIAKKIKVRSLPLYIDNNYIDVIGNIHDNPEMLKEAEQE